MLSLHKEHGVLKIHVETDLTGSCSRTLELFDLSLSINKLEKISSSNFNIEMEELNKNIKCFSSFSQPTLRCL